MRCAVYDVVEEKRERPECRTEKVTTLPGRRQQMMGRGEGEIENDISAHVRRTNLPRQPPTKHRRLVVDAEAPSRRERENTNRCVGRTRFPKSSDDEIVFNYCRLILSLFPHYCFISSYI